MALCLRSKSGRAGQNCRSKSNAVNKNRVQKRESGRAEVEARVRVQAWQRNSMLSDGSAAHGSCPDRGFFTVVALGVRCPKLISDRQVPAECVGMSSCNRALEDKKELHGARGVDMEDGSV